MPQDHCQIKTVQMPNDVFLPFVIEQLKEGHTATLPLRGRSMPQVGDAVLAEISKGCFVLHRIIRINGNQVTLRGDGNLNDEHCLLSDVRAKAVGFYRKDRKTLDRTDGRKWRLYSWWWTRLYPLRRYLLFIIYPHIPQRFK